jgi:hypothetical protein
MRKSFQQEIILGYGTKNQLGILLTLEARLALKRHVKEKNQIVTAFIETAIWEKLERDLGVVPDEIKPDDNLFND